MKQALFRSVVAFVLLVAGSVFAFGQTSTPGSITGTVTDPSGAIVAGANVVAKNNGTGQELTATTSDDGVFTIPQTPPGTYTVTITTAGFNVQDNVLKGSDGFFTFVRPRVDSVDEVTISTATPGAESAGEGAVQIKFTTKSGTSEFHGGLFEYHRNPALNANYWYNN